MYGNKNKRKKNRKRKANAGTEYAFVCAGRVGCYLVT